MIYLKILAALSFVCAIAWMVKEPGFEPALAIGGAMATFISLVVLDKRKKPDAAQQQTVSERSVGIQAGGNVSIGNIGKADDV